MVPKRIFLTKGVGKHRERLTSFELALRDAGIASQNLVRVSSIFPPQCKLVSRSQGQQYLHHGDRRGHLYLRLAVSTLREVVFALRSGARISLSCLSSRSSTAATISGNPMVASTKTSPNFPPSAGGTNLPHDTASVYGLPESPPQ